MGNAILLFLGSLIGALPHAPGSGDERVLLETPSQPPSADGADAADAPDDGPTWPITFYFENRAEAVALSLFDARDPLSVVRDAVAALSHHVRCFRTDRERAVHPRLAEIVARVSEAFGRDRVDVISGFRAPPFGAPHSKHFLGRAMDLRLPGVPSKRVAAWVWKNFRGIGVGVYPKQDFVHVDVRDVDVRWVDGALHGESAHARYFARSPDEALPAGAPRLAYDAPPRAPDALTRVLATAQLGFRGAE